MCKFIIFHLKKKLLNLIHYDFLKFKTFEAVFDYCLESGFKDNIQTYGKISGLWSSLFSLGEFIGPLLGGYIVQKTDFQTATSAVAIICIITVRTEFDIRLKALLS